MNEHYKFRTATIDDKDQLQKLGQNSYGQFERSLTKENWEKLQRYLLAENTYADLLARSTCFVCEIENELVGMAFFIPSGNPTDIFPANLSYLRMVGVHISFEGKGIGRKLIQLCIDYARRTGEDQVALHTGEFMNSAAHIYQSMGFVRVKELDERLGKKYWFYTLDL